MGFFCLKQKIHDIKFTEEVRETKLKNDEKSEEKLTCRFKTDLSNLTNFDSRNQKSQKFTL